MDMVNTEKIDENLSALEFAEKTNNIEEIKKLPLEKRSAKQEIMLAAQEKRQAYCPYCSRPLEVRETQEVDLYWQWDKKEKRYHKVEGDGCSNKPECANCETKDWDFTNNELISY